MKITGKFSDLPEWTTTEPGFCFERPNSFGKNVWKPTKDLFDMNDLEIQDAAWKSTELCVSPRMWCVWSLKLISLAKLFGRKCLETYRWLFCPWWSRNTRRLPGNQTVSPSHLGGDLYQDCKLIGQIILDKISRNQVVFTDGLHGRWRIDTHYIAISICALTQRTKVKRLPLQCHTWWDTKTNLNQLMSSTCTP